MYTYYQNTHTLQSPHTHTHTHTHTLQNPHLHTPTHYKTHTHPHITKPTHTHTHSLQNKLKQPQYKIHTKWNSHNKIKYPQYRVTLMYFCTFGLRFEIKFTQYVISRTVSAIFFRFLFVSFRTKIIPFGARVKLHRRISHGNGNAWSYVQI
jgi:hypothetical protein